jgi:hypothetical protein
MTRNGKFENFNLVKLLNCIHCRFYVGVRQFNDYLTR